MVTKATQEAIDKAIEQAVETALKERLSIRVKAGDFTSPNDRVIELVFDKKVISRDTFDVTQRGEYEG